MFRHYLRAIPRSFYDPNQYRATLTEWRGMGIKYLLLLSAVVALLISASTAYNVHLFRKTELPTILPQIPVVTMNNGIISTDGKEPIIIQADDNPYKLVLDTQAEPEEFQKDDIMIGIGRDFISMKTRSGGHEIKELRPDGKKRVIDRNDVARFFDYLVLVFPAALYPVVVLGQLIIYLFQAFVIALASYGLTSVLRERYDIETRIRLAALALTPGAVISTLLLVLLDHQMGMWVNLLLGLLFMYTMLILIRRVPGTN